MANYLEKKKQEQHEGQTLSIGNDDNTSASASSTPEAPKTPTFEYTPYTPSDTVKQAEALLQQQLASKPGAYTSPWQSQLNDIIQKIQNREKFSYDLNGDALYQLYKGQAVQNGKMAMMDTMGQAQAMTGGYGNSYAQSVGQQAYQGELQKLNEVIPELYQLALDQHNREGDAMYDQASLLAGMEEQAYGRHRDQMSDYYTELDRLINDSRYQAEQDYGKWMDKTNLDYGIHRDTVADQQWQAQFDEAKRQYDEQMALTKGKTSNDSDPDGKPGDNDFDNEGLSENQIQMIEYSLGLTADGKWGAEDREAAGGLDAKDAYNAWNQGKLGEPVGAAKELRDRVNAANSGSIAGFTGKTYSEAVAYLQTKGISASGLMTQSEWQGHKNNNNSGGGEHEASSYQEYLAAYIYGKTK